MTGFDNWVCKYLTLITSILLLWIDMDEDEVYSKQCGQTSFQATKKMPLNEISMWCRTPNAERAQRDFETNGTVGCKGHAIKRRFVWVTNEMCIWRMLDCIEESPRGVMKFEMWKPLFISVHLMIRFFFFAWRLTASLKWNGRNC